MKKLTLLLLALTIGMWAQALTLDKGGLGTWRIGGYAASFPTSMKGVFTRYVQEVDDCTGMDFFAAYKGSAAQFNAYFENGRFCGFCVYATGSIHVKASGRVILGTSSAKTIFTLRGAEGYYVYWDGLGIYVDGVTFYFNESALSPAGKKKVERYRNNADGVKLKSTDFRPEAKPVSVSCGTLPSC